MRCGLLGGIAEVVFLLMIALASLFRCSLVYALLLHFWDLSAHEDGRSSIVDVVDHGVPDSGALKLKDQEGVLLLVGCVPYAMAKFI